MSLRSRVLRGGGYLAVRQAIGMVVGLGGTMLLTRTLGPGKYGLFAAAYGIFMYLQSLCQWGVAVFLIRAEEEPPRALYDQAFTLLLALSTGGILLGMASLPLLGAWMRLEGLAPVAAALFLCLLPLCVAQVPQARLERALDYRRVAWIEVGGQVANYGVALPLAFATRSVWAMVAGMALQAVLQMILLFAAAGYRPRLAWSRPRVREILGYGAGFSASLWIWQLRALVNPLVVGRLAGAESVGYVSLAVRLVEALSFVRTATWRLSISVLAKVQDDRPRLLQVVREGMSLQIMALAPLLLGFGLVAPWVIPRVFGPEWAPVLLVYPFIAFGYLVNSVFSLHSSALYVLRRNWDVSLFHLVHVALFAVAAAWLISRHGIVGYAWAEILVMPTYLVLHLALARRLGMVRYTDAAVWMVVILPLFASWVGPWVWILVTLPLLWSATRRQIFQYAAMLTKRVQGGAHGY
jgi:PST family polysaccharide transporter